MAPSLVTTSLGLGPGVGHSARLHRRGVHHGHVAIVHARQLQLVANRLLLGLVGNLLLFDLLASSNNLGLLTDRVLEGLLVDRIEVHLLVVVGSGGWTQH